MPLTHLISVDLPAPLSPTSAITSPSRTSKSTPRSACTEPKLFETPRSSSVAVADIGAFVSRPGRAEQRPGRDGGSYLQYFLYGPVQTWLLFRKPSAKSS